MSNRFGALGLAGRLQHALWMAPSQFPVDRKQTFVVKQAEFGGLKLFLMRGFDGGWKGWIVNEFGNHVFGGAIASVRVSERAAKSALWKVACEREAIASTIEPEWTEQAPFSENGR